MNPVLALVKRKMSFYLLLFNGNRLKRLVMVMETGVNRRQQVLT